MDPEDVHGFNELDVAPVNGTRAYKGRRGRVALIHKLCTKRQINGSFTLQPLYPWRKRPGAH